MIPQKFAANIEILKIYESVWGCMYSIHSSSYTNDCTYIYELHVTYCRQVEGSSKLYTTEKL